MLQDYHRILTLINFKRFNQTYLTERKFFFINAKVKLNLNVWKLLVNEDLYFEPGSKSLKIWAWLTVHPQPFMTIISKHSHNFI